jgi:hypothetical protein
LHCIEQSVSCTWPSTRLQRKLLNHTLKNTTRISSSLCNSSGWQIQAISHGKMK